MNLANPAPQSARGAIRAGPTLAYAGTAYALFLCVFLAFLAFVGGLPLPRPFEGAVTSPWLAAGIDIALVLGFGHQHSIMAPLVQAGMDARRSEADRAVNLRAGRERNARRRDRLLAAAARDGLGRH